MSIVEGLPPSRQIAAEHPEQLTPEAIARLRVLVKGAARPGRSPEALRARILADASSIAEDVIGPAADGTYRACCMKLWEEEATEEKRWAHRTTNDAIEAAFESLGRAGIVAIENAGGTQSMGWAEVNEEIAKRESKKKKVLGAVFYHSQDLARGVAGEGLWLTFGARDGNEDGSRVVAEMVPTSGSPASSAGPSPPMPRRSFDRPSMCRQSRSFPSRPRSARTKTKASVPSRTSECGQAPARGT